MSHTEMPDEASSNPINLVEQLASLNEWTFERSSEHEISLSIAGRHADYHVSFQWMGDIEALHLACAFDLTVPEPRCAEVLKLLAAINEQLWVGHFDLWRDERMVMYRNALVLAGGAVATNSQCEAILKAGLDAVERCYPAFQYVIWSGQSTEEVLKGVLFETQGEA